MKLSSLAMLAFGATAHAHAIAQKIRINGADQGQNVAIRVPNSNNPITNVNDGNIACNSGYRTPVSTVVATVPAGAQVGIWWQHVIGGPQFSGDPDNPIAKSHKGPLIYYLAKVSNAASTGTSGLQWFKVAEDGLDGSGQWGVDRMINGGGWSTFTMPSCVAPGQYLLRAEIIALHSATNQGGAQFYMSCAQINITGGGSKTGTTMSFPGAYKATDPGILVSIYDAKGVPNGGGKPYTIPGGPAMTC